MLENKDCCHVVSKFIQDVKQRKISGSYNIAVSTVELLKKIITQTEWKTAEELLKLIKDESKHLRQNLPLHPTVLNIVRRILKIIREEHAGALKEKAPQESLLLMLTEKPKVNYGTPVPDLKESILTHIRELESELENSIDNILGQACEQIHPNEIILTIGKSSLVEAFLKAAAAERKFEVFVAECAPFCLGHEMALRLAQSKIKTAVIADSAVFALMSRVNKVIIGANAVAFNGALQAICGTYSLALAAKHFSVSVHVLAPTYKLSTMNLDTQNEFNSSMSPEGVLNYSDGAILSKVHVYNPLFERVPENLVTLLISNTGGHSIDYLSRLLSELYHEADKNV